MIQNSPTGVAQAEAVDQWLMTAACKTVRDDGRSLGTLFGLGGKPFQVSDGAKICEGTRELIVDGGD